MAHSLSPLALKKILRMVDTARWGTTTSAFIAVWELIVDAGFHPETFVEISWQDVAGEIGAHRSTAGACLKRLVAEGVLESGRAAEGQTAIGYRFTDIERWEGVRWRGKLTAAEAALIVERYLRPVEVAPPPFARGRVRAQSVFARGRDRAPARGHGRALRASDAGSARGHVRAQNRASDAPDTLLTTKNNPPPDERIDNPKGGAPTRREGVLFAGITRITGGQYLGDAKWKARVSVIAANEEVDVERLVADVEPMARANRSGPSQIVIFYEQAAAAQLAGETVDDRARELAKIETDLKVYRRKLAVYEAEGDDELANIARAQVAECENRISTLRAEEGAA